MQSKIDELEKKADKYDQIIQFIGTISQENNNTQTPDLEKAICPYYPTVTLSKSQIKLVKSKTKGTEAIRMLIDMLFDYNIYNQKNYTYLAENFPEKIKSIERFIGERYGLESAKITKTITNKCRRR